jgi:hypothetical protein
MAFIDALISWAGTPQEVYDALNKLGFDSFRCGQEEAIMQILCGNNLRYNILYIMSTGFFPVSTSISKCHRKN